ncbi:phage major capsid protein, HK97 family [Amycolatopsis marina]|uniref:Phage major capsid protein, HK97 family n=1 Tax=Amycolatopsis marina TaxID=490629 RepID=A0A1I1CFH0_9PSEU|nr:phage major capsid protein [Amycolatopsis marina]SFB61197.1 phage major capsid protein, HK97 family [Amycolatopsis marina]
MAISSTNSTGFLPPDYVASAVWALATDQSVALQVTDLYKTSAHTVHIPVINATSQANWIGELQPITESTPTWDELQITPLKLAALTRVSREVALDSSMSAVNAVMNGMAVDLGRKLDAALFANPAPVGAPAGLPSAVSTVVDSNGFANLDPFLQAQSEAAELGATLSAFITDPATALKVRSLKVGTTGSNQYLIDISAQGVTVAGVPLYVSPSVEAGTAWGIDRSRVITVASELAELDISEDSAFNLNALDIRGILRAAFAITSEASVVKIVEVV